MKPVFLTFKLFWAALEDGITLTTKIPQPNSLPDEDKGNVIDWIPIHATTYLL